MIDRQVFYLWTKVPKIFIFSHTLTYRTTTTMHLIQRQGGNQALTSSRSRRLHSEWWTACWSVRQQRRLHLHPPGTYDTQPMASSFRHRQDTSIKLTIVEDPVAYLPFETFYAYLDGTAVDFERSGAGKQRCTSQLHPSGFALTSDLAVTKCFKLTSNVKGPWNAMEVEVCRNQVRKAIKCLTRWSIVVEDMKPAGRDCGVRSSAGTGVLPRLSAGLPLVMVPYHTEAKVTI